MVAVVMVVVVVVGSIESGQVGNRTVAAISASSSQDRKRTPLLIITTHKPTTLPLWHCKKLPKRLSLGGAHNKRVIFPAIIVGNQQKLKSSSRR